MNVNENGEGEHGDGWPVACGHIVIRGKNQENTKSIPSAPCPLSRTRTLDVPCKAVERKANLGVCAAKLVCDEYNGRSEVREELLPQTLVLKHQTADKNLCRLSSRAWTSW